MRSFSLWCLFGLLLAAPVVAAEPDWPRLVANGDSVDPGGEEPTFASTQVAAGEWQSIALSGNDLVIARVTAIRASDWAAALGTAEEGWPTLARREFLTHGKALDLPAGAEFGLRWLDAGTQQPWLADGRRASVLSAPVTLHSGWQLALRLGARQWTVATRDQRQADGRLLAGSMRLVRIDEAGQETELLGHAPGMAFRRQEILWLGDLDQDEHPDLLVKRSLLTGEHEYLLASADRLGTVSIDPDRPYQAFSSGVENSAGLLRHRLQTAALPPPNFGRLTLAIGELEWNGWLASTGGIPTLRYDRSMNLDGEILRITVESIPTATHDAQRQESSASHWGGGLLIRTSFRGRTQVLLHTGALDGSDMQIALDRIDGQPALRLEYYPHYNNGMTQYWSWSDESGGRFKRLVSYHEQGC